MAAVRGADPHEYVDPFTYRLNMSALDWAKVRAQLSYLYQYMSVIS